MSSGEGLSAAENGRRARKHTYARAVIAALAGGWCVGGPAAAAAAAADGADAGDDAAAVGAAAGADAGLASPTLTPTPTIRSASTTTPAATPTPTTMRIPAPARYETVVRAARAPDATPLEDRVASASVITRDRTLRSGESLEDLLAELPGVTVTRFGGLGSASFISIRGSTAEQVRVYLDGVPLNVASGGGVDLSTIALGDVERIEVYRGTSPMAFGVSALGGIVSITTRRPRANQASGEVGVGSFGTRFAGANGALAGRTFHAFAGVHLIETAGDFGYHDNNNTPLNPNDDSYHPRYNNALHQLDTTLRVGATLPGRRELTLSALGLDRAEGLPGINNSRSLTASLATLRGIGSLAYDSRDDLGPGGRVRVAAYVLALQERFDDPDGNIAIVPTRSRDRHLDTGLTAVLSRPVTDGLRLTALADGQWEGYWPYDELVPDPNGATASRRLGSLGLEADSWWSRAQLEVIPSVRVEASRDVRTGRSTFHAFLGPSAPIDNVFPVLRASAVQHPSTELAIKANVGRYTRIPNMTELYGNDGFLIGNATLRPETGSNADLGVSSTLGSPVRGATVQLTLFAALVDDLIQFNPSTDGHAVAENIDRARITGVELSGEARFASSIRIVGQTTFTDARDTSNNSDSRGRQLPNRPRYRAYLRPELRRHPLPGGVLEVGAYADADLTGGDYLDSGDTVGLPPRLLVGAGAQLGWVDGPAQLVFSARNLGDSRVADLVGFPLPGRSFFVSLVGTTEPTTQKEPYP